MLQDGNNLCQSVFKQCCKLRAVRVGQCEERWREEGQGKFEAGEIAEDKMRRAFGPLSRVRTQSGEGGKWFGVRGVLLKV